MYYLFLFVLFGRTFQAKEADAAAVQGVLVRVQGHHHLLLQEQGGVAGGAHRAAPPQRSV